jgi:hypothetical protein
LVDCDIFAKPFVTVLLAGRKTAAQQARQTQNMLLCGSRLVRLDCAAFFSLQNVFGVLDTHHVVPLSTLFLAIEKMPYSSSAKEDPQLLSYSRSRIVRV